MWIRYTLPGKTAQKYEWQGNNLIIGRRGKGASVDLDLSGDLRVSRPHARLTCEDGVCWIEDLGSKHGTLVNGDAISAKTPLKQGDRVQIGETTLEVEMETSAPVDLAAELEAPQVILPVPPSEPQMGDGEHLTEGETPIEEGTILNTIGANEPPADMLLPGDAAETKSLEAARRRLNAFCNLATALGTMASTETLAETVVQHIREAFPAAERAGLLLCEGKRLLPKAHWPKRERPAYSRSLADKSITRREAFCWQRQTQGEMSYARSLDRLETQCALYAPLVWKQEVLGVVYADNATGCAAFAEDDPGLLMALANLAALFISHQAFKEQAARERELTDALLKPLPPRVAEWMRKNRGRIRPGGEWAKPVTILFSDVRGFTAFSAVQRPDDIVQLLNDMFNEFNKILVKYNATIDKYVGDAILAVFGSPEPDEEQWEHAVRAGLEMQQVMPALARRWQDRGLPALQIGIGIHTGEVVHGFVGSAERLEYTVIGDAVNRASRFCDAAAAGEILISREVYQYVHRLVETRPKTIRSKHPETEPDQEAYVVVGLEDG
ncbi:MAG: adenylate/guanylate cyclase domain-containing protein [Thermodesulfobacteriota bacterium]